MIQSKKLTMGTMYTITASATYGVTVTLSCSTTGQSSTNGSLTVPEGSTVTYLVPAYNSASAKNGSVVMNSNKTLTATYSTTYTDTSWSAPHNMTSNGTMGGSSYAASCNDVKSGSAYYMFDGISSNYNNTSVCSPKGTSYFYFFTPTSVRPTSMTIYYAGKADVIRTGTAYIHGSTTGSSYSQLASFTWNWRTMLNNNVQTASVSLSTSNYYKYFRISIDSTTYDKYIVEWYISGYYQSASKYWSVSIS